MENLSDEPLYKDNSVGLLVDGPATYDAMLGAVRAAQRYIHVEMYIIGDDEVGRTFAKLLIEKAQQGVAVRVLYDSIGSWEASAGFFDRMREAKIADDHPQSAGRVYGMGQLDVAGLEIPMYDSHLMRRTQPQRTHSCR